MEITITEGLATLKNLNNRIQKETREASFVTSSVGGKIQAKFKTREDFEQRAKSTFQSLRDLIDRRNKIKASIVASNAATNVTIAGKSYKVAEAIERKSSVALEQQIVATMLQQFNVAQRSADEANTQAQARLDRLLEQTFGKDAKTDPKDIEAMTKGFMATNEGKLVDPIGIIEITEKMNQDIQDFLSNVDVALSISNSTTKIVVE